MVGLPIYVTPHARERFEQRFPESFSLHTVRSMARTLLKQSVLVTYQNDNQLWEHQETGMRFVTSISTDGNALTILTCYPQ